MNWTAIHQQISKRKELQNINMKASNVLVKWRLCSKVADFALLELGDKAVKLLFILSPVM